MKVLIIDDHPVVRAGLAALLNSSDPHLRILQAPGCSAGLELAEQHPDLGLVFMDLRLPGEDGVSAIAEFRGRRPSLPLIVISSSESPDDVRAALAAGALGYVPKSAAPQTLFGAMKLVLSGEIYVPPFVLDAPPTGPAARLTARQRDVLALLSEGATNKAIARRLALSEKTVKIHVSAILRELGVANRTQAVHAARALLGAREPDQVAST